MSENQKEEQRDEDGEEEVEGKEVSIKLVKEEMQQVSIKSKDLCPTF